MSETGYVDEVEPSLELVCLLLGIHADDEVGFESRIAAVAGWERLIAWATAMQAEQLVAIDLGAKAAEYDWDSADRSRSLTEVLGLALKVSGGSAVRRLLTTETLLGKTPAVHEALKAGAITTHHARVVTSAAADLPVEVAQQAAAATMVDDDGWRTPVRCGETFARHVLALDPDGAADRARAAAKGRRVARRSEPDGMASLWALLPAADCAAVYDRVDACARSSLATNRPGDERTLDARRVDALVQLVLGQIPHGHRGDPTDPTTGDADAGDRVDIPAPPSEPIRHGRKATAHVTVAWSTLIGLDDRPAHLAGYGPIDAATARRIAADPTSTLDPTAHRPRVRDPARPRPHEVPPTAGPAGLRHRPRPLLSVPRLRTRRRRLRPRPSTRLGPRRHHLRRLPGLPVPTPPPAQTPRRLDPPA